jgi:excisionase family DNA binding protein
VDIPSAAKLMNVGPWAIRNLLWGRKIPFVKIGKKHLIDPADLRVFIDQTKAVA